MTFEEVLTQVRELLQRKGRVSYRALKLQFDLQDDYLEGLKDELVDAERVAGDENGKVLVWVGEHPVVSSQHSVVSREKADRQRSQATNPRPLIPDPQPPAAYTPPHLAERIRAEQAALEARSGTDGERKTITALFADLKGSTALIENLDPEEARAIIDPALQLMMDAVHRYEGYVAQALGDGIFALFGAPIAHEDHPQRAVYAALRMQEAMRRYSDHVRLKGGPPLQLRVGLNTGEVVVRSIRKDDLHTDYVPVGHSTNLAARMEQMATPGSILITDYTRKLVEGYVELKALGTAEIKGVEELLPVYEVLGAGPLRTRLQVSARRGLTRFVGRQREMEQLTRALEHVKVGHGQIVGVMGEPGLGKSRLFHEFVGAYGHTPLLALQAYSVSYGKASPYLPVIELLKSYFQIEQTDDERQRRAKVMGHVLALDRSLEGTLPYLLTLLGIEDPDSSLQPMDAQIRRRRTFEALRKLFLRESLNQPLLLIFEDLHWIDVETQGFLDTLSESIASAKIVLLTNYRPEYRHEWGSKTYYTQLRLAPLGREEAEELLTFLLGSDTSLKALKQLILAKTEGTPFFMEEVVQTLAEEGVLSGERGQYRLEKAPTELHISPTVQGVLAARIDRLAADEKALLQQLAVIGRQFPLSLMRQVVAHPEEALYQLLASLQRKEFLYEQPAFPEVEYQFKHALTQDVAYNSVLVERRKVLHEQIGHAIEQLHYERLEEHYSELAHHYSRSNNTEKAIEYLDKAGQQAVQRSALAEATTYFTTALELLQTLAETPERAHQELTLQVALATPLSLTKGPTAPEVGAVHRRALELCRQVGETPQLSPALWAARRFYLFRGELQTARELAERLIPMAQRAQDSALLPVAHFGLGSVLHSLGELVSARAHCEHALALSDPRQRRSAIAFMGIDLGVFSLLHLANILWLLGYPDQALARSRAGLTLAQEINHPSSMGLVWFTDTILRQFLHEAQAVEQQAEALIALSNEQGFSALLAGALVRHGWALAEQGQAEDGIQQIHQGMAAAHAIGVELYRPYNLALLAEAYRKAGQVEEGLSALSEALTVVGKTGERYYEAELYRLKGELTLQQGARGWGLGTGSSSPQAPSLKPLVPREVEKEAEGYFLKAIEIARKQQAKSLELRATTSLTCLWQQQGKHHAARTMLSEIYHWFTEGFDTQDLKDAKVLLNSLESGV